jgi:hypothetical protein
MDGNDYYRKILNLEYREVIQSLSIKKIGDLSNLEIGAISLALARSHDIENAKKYINQSVNGDFENEALSMINEAKLFVMTVENNDFQKIDEIAFETLELNPKAVYAKILLGRNRIFLEKDLEKSRKYFEGVLTDYPTLDWVYRDLVFFLTHAKEYEEARKVLPKVKPKYFQLIYNFLLNVYLPFPILVWVIVGGLLYFPAISRISPIILGSLFILFRISIAGKIDPVINKAMRSMFLGSIFIYLLFRLFDQFI